MIGRLFPFSTLWAIVVSFSFWATRLAACMLFELQMVGRRFCVAEILESCMPNYVHRFLRYRTMCVADNCMMCEAHVYICALFERFPRVGWHIPRFVRTHSCMYAWMCVHFCSTCTFFMYVFVLAALHASPHLGIVADCLSVGNVFCSVNPFV